MENISDNYQIQVNARDNQRMPSPNSDPTELLRGTISQLKEGVLILDSEHRLVLMNQSASEMLGWKQEELHSKTLHHFIHQHPAKRDECLLLQRLHQKESSDEYADTFSHRNGNAVSVKYTISRIKIQAETTWYIIAFQTSVEKEQKSLSSLGPDSHFKRALATNMFGMIYGGFQGDILETNQAFLDMVGYTWEDFKRGLVRWKDLTPEEYAPLDAAAIQQLKDFWVFQPYEKQFIRKDGSRVDVLLGGFMEDDVHERAMGFVVDISTKKRAERTILKGEELFRRMADSSSALIWFIGPDFQTHYFNKTVQEYCGYTMDEFPDWEQVVHPDDLPTVSASMQNTFEKRERFESIHRNRRADGQYRWVYATGVPVFSDIQEFLGYVGTAIDIHDLKETQARLTEYAHRLEQSNKDLEHFATIASHDLQEPLRKVMLFSDHLMHVMQGNLNTEAIDDLERIQNATGKMQHLINDLLDLSRISRQGQPFRKVDLKVLTEEVVAELRYTYQDIRSRVEINGSVSIDADPDQMRQMMAQLLDNALKFHNPGKPTTVKIDIQAAAKDQCQISITDDGLGIKQEHFSRIFNTFVRLHSGTEYAGTGIGLSLVKKIIERHNGGIIVESTLGQGSTFTVMLPVHNRAAFNTLLPVFEMDDGVIV